MTTTMKKITKQAVELNPRSLRAAAGWVLLAVLAFAGCSGTRSEDRVREAETRLSSQAILVNSSDVATAARERLESGITFTGELAPVDLVNVGARFDGDLERILVREGDRVRKGQSMAVFKPVDVNNYYQAAQADLLSARAMLVSAENGERRARRLLEAGAAAPSDLEAAEAGHAAAEARVRAAQTQFDLAKDNAEKLAVPAPISGWVSRVVVHPGDHVVSGDPMLTLVRRDTLELTATVPSEALARVRLGSAIMIRLDAFPDEAFTGRLDRINPTTEPGTRQVRIYARVPNTDGRLVGGLFATGRIVDEVRENAVTVPIGVLRREGTEQVIYRLSGGRAQRLLVQTGLTDEERGRVELRGEVEPGDSLLSGIVPGLRDQAQVRVIRNGESGPASGAESVPGTSTPGTQSDTESGTESGTQSGTQSSTGK